MKASDFIWPDKWIPFKVRVFVVILAWTLWLVVLYLKYFVFQVDGVLQVVGFYPILIIWTYLFNRSLSMAPGSAYFDASNMRLQAARTCIFVIAVIAFLSILFVGDW